MGSAVALILAAGACRSNEPPSRTPEPPPEPSIKTPSSSVGAPNTTAGGGQGSLASASDRVPSGTTTTQSLTDSQILYVLHAANVSEIEQARMAQTKAQNARVKRFAAMMLEDHGQADAKANEVAKKTQSSLAPSQTSERLESDAKQLSSKVAAQQGSDFDRAYIDAQVKGHRAVLQSIDRELLPAVRSTEVKDLVQTVRAKVEGHLTEAEQIQKGLAGG